MVMEIDPLVSAMDEVTGGRPGKVAGQGLKSQSFKTSDKVVNAPLSRLTGFESVNKAEELLSQARAFYEESGGEMQTPDGPVKMPFEEFVRTLASQWGAPSNKAAREIGKE